MTDPVQYGECAPLPAGATCLLCGASPLRMNLDHCHTHGWARGPACSRCNVVMGLLDRGQMPSDMVLFHVPLSSLIEHAARCPDCPPVAVEGLRESIRHTSVTARAADRDILQAAIAQFAPHVMGHVSNADVLSAALRVARAREDEWLRELDSDPLRKTRENGPAGRKEAEGMSGTDKPTIHVDTTAATQTIAELRERLAEHRRACPKCGSPGHEVDHGWVDGVRRFDTAAEVLDIERNLLPEIMRDDPPEE